MCRLVFLSLVAFTLQAQKGDTLLPKILEIKNDTERVNQLYTRGFALRLNDPQLSVQYAQLCERHALATHSQKHIAKSYNLTGVLYYRKGDLNAALGYHLKALQLRTRCGDLQGVANSQINLGNIYSDRKLYGKAEDAYLEAMKIYKLAGAADGLIKCLVNISVVKHHLKQYDATIENCRMAMTLAAANDYNTRAMCLTNIGEAFVDKGDLEQALACNEDALKLRILGDNATEVADNYLNLGEICILKKEFTQAKQYIDTACYIARQYDYFEISHEASRIYSQYYEAVADYAQALQWLKRYKALGDSLQLEEINERVQYDFNADITHAGDGAAPTHNLWLLLSIVAAFVIIPFYLIRFKR